MLDKDFQIQETKAQIEKTKRTIVSNNILIGYYESRRNAEDDEKEKAIIQMKIDQIQKSNEFNIGYVEFAEEQLAALMTE